MVTGSPSCVGELMMSRVKHEDTAAAMKHGNCSTALGDGTIQQNAIGTYAFAEELHFFLIKAAGV